MLSCMQVVCVTHGGIPFLGAQHCWQCILNCWVLSWWSWIGHSGELKSDLLFTPKKTSLSLFTYITSLLHWEIKISFHCTVSESRLWRWYSVLQKVEAKTCHLKLTEVPMVKWKMFILHCFRTQPHSWHSACKEGYSLEGVNGCKSSLTVDKKLYSNCTIM